MWIRIQDLVNHWFRDKKYWIRDKHTGSATLPTGTRNGLFFVLIKHMILKFVCVAKNHVFSLILFTEMKINILNSTSNSKSLKKLDTSFYCSADILL
jgi:hypothetical protein